MSNYSAYTLNNPVPPTAPYSQTNNPPQAYVTTALFEKSFSSTWYPNNDASHHVTPDLNLIHQLIPYHGHE